MEEEKLDVKSVYRKYKISHEKRKFTKSLLTTLSRPTLNKIEEGEVYCMRYDGHDSRTDKWHVYSVVYVTEAVGLTVTGINLLYLNPSISLNILSAAENVKGALRESVFYKELEREFENAPISCAKKRFSANGITRSVKLKREDWGMVPLIEKSLFGNLNAEALQADWKKEQEELFEKKRERKKKRSTEISNTYEVEEDMFSRPWLGASASIFDEDAVESLESLRDEILEDDDEDI